MSGERNLPTDFTPGCKHVKHHQLRIWIVTPSCRPTPMLEDVDTDLDINQ